MEAIPWPSVLRDDTRSSDVYEVQPDHATDCDRCGADEPCFAWIAAHPAPVTSPWVRNAVDGVLPAKVYA